MPPPDICAAQLDQLVTAIKVMAGVVTTLAGVIVFLFYRLEKEKTDRLADAQKMLPVVDEGVKIMRDLTTRRSRR